MWQVIGQEKAVSLLRRSLETGAVSHAYLFIGPAHSGKMTLALDLARALNCEEADIPCGSCDSCHKIDEGKHADVQVTGITDTEGEGENKSKTEISIEQIRSIQHAANLPPFEGKYKVFIIEGAESLSIEAANALLKTLEEPENRVVFILLVSDSALLPETVVSRCQPVELVPVPASEIENVLRDTRGVEAEKAALIARLSRGHFGWAVSAAKDDSLLEQRAEMLDKILDIIESDYEDRFAYSLQLSNRFGRDRAQVYEQLDLWLDWWRDLLLVKTGAVNTVSNSNRLGELKEMADGRSLRQIREFIGNIQSAGEQLRRNANARLALEVLMLHIPEAKSEKEVVSSE